MSRKAKLIPINPMANEFGLGVSIERMSFANMGIAEMEQGKQTHRHDGHTFVLLERGSVSLEIDFKTYHVEPSMVVYVHPDQVHRTIASENVTVCAWTITDENLNPEYLKLLEDIMPAEPIALDSDMFTVMTEAISLSFKFSQRKTDKLYHSLLKDSCNALVALVISQYFEHATSSKFPSRFETVNNDRPTSQKSFIFPRLT
jgi:AraC family transcriptional activator of pobA